MKFQQCLYYNVQLSVVYGVIVALNIQQEDDLPLQVVPQRLLVLPVFIFWAVAEVCRIYFGYVETSRRRYAAAAVVAAEAGHSSSSSNNCHGSRTLGNSRQISMCREAVCVCVYVCGHVLVSLNFSCDSLTHFFSPLPFAPTHAKYE